MGQSYFSRICRLRTNSRTRAKTCANFIPKAAGTSDYWKEFSLICKDERHLLGAISKLEEIVQPANGISRSPASRDGSKTTKQANPWTTRKEHIGDRPTSQADIVPDPPPRPALDVEARPPAPDQLQLAEQGCEFTRRVLPG